MVDWLDPATWHVGVKTATALARLLDRLRKKTAGRRGGEDTRKHLEVLIGIVADLIDIMIRADTRAARNHKKFVKQGTKSISQLTAVLRGFDRRIMALEKASKKKPTKRKRRG
jgi:hypothetical protein